MPKPGAEGRNARPSVLAAVRFPFEGPDWSHNLLLSSVFVLIPVVGALALYGFMCEVIQRLVRGDPQPVPKLDFKDFGHYLGRGVAPFVVALVVGMLLGFLLMGGVLAALLGGLLVSRASESALLAGACYGLGGVICLLVGGLGTILAQAAALRAELTGEIGEGLALGKLFGFARLAWWQILYRTFLLTCLTLPLVLGGYCLCVVGVYAAAAVIVMARTHLRWQIYRDYLARGGEPIPVKPAQALPSETPPAAPYYPPAPGGWR
jgi:hypothetical protein